MIDDDFVTRLLRGEAFSGVGFNLRNLIPPGPKPRKL
jgi:hypothetical protein